MSDLSLLTLVALGAACVVLFALHLWLRGEDLRRFDDCCELPVERFAGRDPSHPDQQTIALQLHQIRPLLQLPLREQLGALRKYMDGMFATRHFDANFVETNAAGVPGEWVLGPGADPARRTLYIHGGAFTMGSRLSHRPLTTAFSTITRGAVLAIDYRLMPEHSRQAGIDDCRTAYRWLLDNGPTGAGASSEIFVAGDSAGGNLTLALIAWVRDSGLRAPNAAVALSPLTDGCFTSPSVYLNHTTDLMLGPLTPWVKWLPRRAYPWMGWVMARRRPCDPATSPVFGDLSELPPTLIQASESEMLLDDARRYAAKAMAAGSPVRLQTWSHMVHVWQMFDTTLVESSQALSEVGRFLAAVPRPVTSASTNLLSRWRH